MSKLRCGLLALLAIPLFFLFAWQCVALDLVQEGKPTASIGIPDESLEAETYAATELQYHVKRATGGGEVTHGFIEGF